MAAVWLFAQESVAQQPVLPPAAPLPADSSPAAAQPAVVEVPFERTVTLQIAGATRALSVNPAIVEATLRAPGVVDLHAAAFGQTFVHIWTPAGRLTRAVTVVQPPIEQPAYVPPSLVKERAAKHLTFEYDTQFRTLQRGPSWSTLDQNTTTTFDHFLTSHMDTPYGDLRGGVAFQRFNSVEELTSWNAAWMNGDVGPLEHFDLFAGDTAVGISDLSLPESTIRGVDVHYAPWDPYHAEVFSGQQRFGFATGLSPGSDAHNDIRLSGMRLRDLGRPWTWDLAYVTSSGEDRADTQTSQAAEGETWYWMQPGLGVGVQGGTTQEHAFGYRVKSALRTNALTVDAVYRNISQNYDNVLGRSPDQGERGVQLASRYDVSRAAQLRQSLDLYRDTLFANTEEPDALNLEMEWGGDLSLTERTQLSSTYSRQRLLGRLFPTDNTSIDTTLRHRLGSLPLIGQGSVFSEYLFRDLRSVSAPDSDFKSHTALVGLGAPLFDAFYWQVTQQWTVLEAALSGDRSYPRATSAGITYSQRFERLPVSLHGGFNFSTASSASSPNSFLADEDRFEWNAGLRYDVAPGTSAFLDSRLVHRRRSSGPEYEVDLATGVHYFFDTGITWQPSAKLSGIVFEDLNGDGQQETEEGGLPHVAVFSGGRRALTDPGGRFYLGSVRGGQLQVAVDLATTPSGYVPTTPSTLTFTVQQPETLSVRFGFVAKAELRAHVFVDANDNGRYDATDMPLPQVRLSLDGAAASTDRSGWAFFRGLNPGPHTLTLQIASLAGGYVPVVRPAQERTLAQGEAAALEFSIRAERSVGGLVYVDQNRNAQYDPDELLLRGVVVCLDDRQATTREDGRYLFKDVAAGSHRVALNCGTPPETYLPLNATVQTLDVSPQPTHLDHVDFRLGNREAIMQDVIADVMAQRQEEAKKAAAMDEAVNEALRKRQSGPAP